MREQEVFFHDCELITPLEKDPIPLAKGAMGEIERTNPGEVSFTEAVETVIPLLNAHESIRNSICIGVIHKVARRKREEQILISDRDLLKTF
jgi:hypothetical protein